MEDKSDVLLGSVCKAAGAVSTRSLLGNDTLATGAVLDREREGPASSEVTPIVNAVNCLSIPKLPETWSADPSSSAPFTSNPKVPEAAASDGGDATFDEGL